MVSLYPGAVSVPGGSAYPYPWDMEWEWGWGLVSIPESPTHRQGNITNSLCDRGKSFPLSEPQFPHS